MLLLKFFNFIILQITLVCFPGLLMLVWCTNSPLNLLLIGILDTPSVWGGLTRNPHTWTCCLLICPLNLILLIKIHDGLIWLIILPNSRIDGLLTQLIVAWSFDLDHIFEIVDLFIIHWLRGVAPTHSGGHPSHGIVLIELLVHVHVLFVLLVNYLRSIAVTVASLVMSTCWVCALLRSCTSSYNWHPILLQIIAIFS